MSEVPEVLPPAPSITEDTPPVQEPDPDAVVIFKRTDEQGNVNTAIQTLGSVQPTEVQTLIELGLRGWREQLGFKP